VTAVGILIIVLASLGVLGGLLIVAGGGAITSKGEAGGFVGPVLLVIGLFTLIISGVWLVSGIGILVRKQWARILAIILGLLSIITSLLTLASGNPFNIASAIISIALTIFILVVLFGKGREFS
jgi:hypothetical protein